MDQPRAAAAAQCPPGDSPALLPARPLRGPLWDQVCPTRHGRHCSCDGGGCSGPSCWPSGLRPGARTPVQPPDTSRRGRSPPAGPHLAILRTLQPPGGPLASGLGPGEEVVGLGLSTGKCQFRGSHFGRFPLRHLLKPTFSLHRGSQLDDPGRRLALPPGASRRARQWPEFAPGSLALWPPPDRSRGGLVGQQGATGDVGAEGHRQSGPHPCPVVPPTHPQGKAATPRARRVQPTAAGPAGQTLAGKTRRREVLSLTLSPLGPRNPSGPLSPLSP